MQPKKPKERFPANSEARGGWMTEVVPPIFRLGDNKRNREVLIGKERVLCWNLSKHDKQLAKIAGWDKFNVHYKNGTGFIYLPIGTRNAHSVLSGMEALAGEKAAVVERGAEYIKDIYDKFGAFDTGFSWKQVGITPKQKIFIAPPNTPYEATAQEVSDWQNAVTNELSLLLQSDEANSQLVDRFAATLTETQGNVG